MKSHEYHMSCHHLSDKVHGLQWLSDFELEASGFSDRVHRGVCSDVTHHKNPQNGRFHGTERRWWLSIHD